jgi:hypothetical protein
LDLATISPNLFGLSPLLIQERHDHAFDVEPVTEEFYRRYHLAFDTVKKLIRGIRDHDRKHLFTQRLFNRLMFIAFIQKKGWLQFGGSKHQDYLNALWSDYKKNGNKEMGFYYERMYNLFFHGLGAQDDVGISNINRGGVWADFIGKVPYLNGGLFEEDDDDKDGSIKVPDEAVGAILHDLFNHFNFTVTEATPLDIEVAVDPEMLGKVFEELVTGRHETGSYYTPKPIVSFMCRETLKGYLQANLSREKPETLAKFVDEHEASGLRDAEAVLEALRRVRVCDPACGSGAYLLGMLHELMDLRNCLFSAKKVDPIPAYDRKLEIIQKNIYGVDADLFAVNIARLRLWLSLAVEFEGDKPAPLPNLKFEIEQGDSLAAPGPDPEQGLMWSDEIRRFGEAKAKYMKSHGDAKRTLETTVIELKNSISSWTHHGKTVNGFDWAVEFAEVFGEGGFDIVLANPPYIRHELILEQKPNLQIRFKEVYSGTADLYVYFYARGLEILRPGGMFAYISSNKWLIANYGKKLRQLLSSKHSMKTLVDFGDLPVFKSATAYPLIITIQRDCNPGATIRYVRVLSLEPPYPDVSAILGENGSDVDSKQLSGSSWSFSAPRPRKLSGPPNTTLQSIATYLNGRVYYGIKTGYNKAFVIDTATRNELVRQDGKSRDLIQPLAQGRDIRKWIAEPRDRWMIVTQIGVDIKRYPAVFQHLRQYRRELERRSDQGNHWWELRPCDYYDLFPKPKIVYQVFQVKPCFAFDEKGTMVNNSVYLIPSDDLYLLGVLNSRPFWREIQRTCSQIQNGYQLMLSYFLNTTIPLPKDDERGQIAKLSAQCVLRKGLNCEDIEREIDLRIAPHYGLSPSDLDD